MTERVSSPERFTPQKGEPPLDDQNAELLAMLRDIKRMLLGIA